MQVDFDNFPQQHETMIHVPLAKVSRLLDTLYRDKVLDAMAVHIKPPHTRCRCDAQGVASVPTRLCIVFSNRAGGGGSEATRTLWNVLLHRNLRVTWKHGNFGGTIVSGFEIVDSWELDDGMC